MSRFKNFVRLIKFRLLHILPSHDIYMFHHVSNNPSVDLSSCKLDTESFISFVSVDRNYVSLEKIVESDFSKKASAITFDDGLEDVYTIAYPILKELKVPFTVFVLSDFIDNTGYLNSEQLMDLSKDSLVTIGVHGLKHDLLTTLSTEGKKAEIVESKTKIEKLIGRECVFRAYIIVPTKLLYIA